MSLFLFSLSLAHSAYFLLTGLWPLVHMPSFLAVTGPKRDLWLVRTVGVLIVAIALPIGLSALRRAPSPEIFLLAVGSALALMLVDVVYVARKVISPIYLADAGAELILILLWLLAWLTR